MSKILDGLQDAVAFARGDRSRGKEHVIMRKEREVATIKSTKTQIVIEVDVPMAVDKRRLDAFQDAMEKRALEYANDTLTRLKFSDEEDA